MINRVQRLATTLTACLLAGALNACSAVNAVIPQVATMIAPPAEPTARPPRATRTPRPATAVPAVVPVNTRVPRPTLLVNEALPTPTEDIPAEATLAPETDAPAGPVATKAPADAGGAGDVQTITIKENSNGSTTFVSDSPAFGITLPPGWRMISLDNVEDMRADLRAIAPVLENTIGDRLADQLSGPLQFFAVDAETVDTINPNAITANVNVLITKLPNRTTLRAIMSQASAEMRNISGIRSEIGQKTLRLKNGGEAGLLTYDVMVTNRDGSETPSASSQYLLLRGDTIFVLTMFAPSERASDYTPVFREMVEKFSTK